MWCVTRKKIRAAHWIWDKTKWNKTFIIITWHPFSLMNPVTREKCPCPCPCPCPWQSEHGPGSRHAQPRCFDDNTWPCRLKNIHLHNGSSKLHNDKVIRVLSVWCLFFWQVFHLQGSWLSSPVLFIRVGGITSDLQVSSSPSGARLQGREQMNLPNFWHLQNIVAAVFAVADKSESNVWKFGARHHVHRGGTSCTQRSPEGVIMYA